MTTLNDSAVAARVIASDRSFNARRFFLQWEWLLLLLFIIINVVNSNISANYFVATNLLSSIQLFLDKALLVFPMMMIILLGEIDISIASTMALSAVLMGVSYQAGVPMPVAIGIALATGVICGFINGYIRAQLRELASMIITLSTMIIYRGIASIILEDRAVMGFPTWFNFLGWGKVGPIPVILLVFLVEAAVFAYIIHFTRFGRSLYAIGFNEEAAAYSGIGTKRVKIIVFTVMGLIASITALFLASKLSSVRPSVAKGYELDVIAMVVLGGVSTSGGRGRVVGVLLSIFIIGLLRYGLGIVNVPANTILVIIGALLIIAVAIPNLKEALGIGGRMSRKESAAERNEV